MTQEPPPTGRQNHLGRLPYAIGGCSFIPLVGVLFGIVAIVWGLLKRRQGGWKLVVLGGGGILFTIVFYGVLIFVIPKDSSFFN